MEFHVADHVMPAKNPRHLARTGALNMSCHHHNICGKDLTTVKNCIKKARASQIDEQLALLCIKATPLISVIPSAPELLYNRRIRSNIPIKIKGTHESQMIVEHLRECQERQKQYYDVTAKDLPELKPGQAVSMEDNKWKPGYVL